MWALLAPQSRKTSLGKLQKPLLPSRKVPISKTVIKDLHSDESGTEKVAKLMCLLATPSALSGMVPSHPDGFLDYRQRNLLWRTGSAEGTKGEITEFELKELHIDDACREVTLADIPVTPFLRASSWPSFAQKKKERNLWMLSEDLESDLKRGFPHIWAQLQSWQGYFVQMLVLVLVVLTYSTVPLTVSWAKIVGFEGDGAGAVPIKGRPFKESSVIVASWGLVTVVGLLLSAALGGRRAVLQCLDTEAIVRFSPAGVGWALADVCEVLALARIDPATYGVISQARLLGSAAACWLLRGMRQTQLQWGVLLSLSLVCMGYCLLPDDPVNNKERLFQWRVAHAEVKIDWYTDLSQAQPEQGGQDYYGVDFVAGELLALMKVGLSVLSGVYGESCFKPREGSVPADLHVQMTQISFSSALTAVLGYLVICLVQGEDPGDFFGGPDGRWGWRTLTVAVVYCGREWICNLCVKRFDSLVKNICNAVALVVTYGFTVAVTREKPFVLLKVMLLLAIVAQVVNYVATRRSPDSSGTGAAVERECKTEEAPAPEISGPHVRPRRTCGR